jgi:hypothetical protein
MYFEDTIDEVKYCGHLFGLGSSLFQNGIPYEAYIPSQALIAQQHQTHPHNSASQTSLANLGSNLNPTNISNGNANNSNSTNNFNSASAPNLTNLVPSTESKLNL